MHTTLRGRLLATIVFAGLVAPVVARGDDTLAAIADLKRAKPVDFEAEVLPILKRNCVACHNATTAESALKLETPQQMLKGGDNGPAVVPQKGLESLLIVRARGGGDGIMPPADNKVAARALTAEELALIRLWIDQGATGQVKAQAEAIQWQALPPGVNPIYAVALSPDGQFVACGRANQVFVYQVATGRFVCRLTDPALLSQGIYRRPGVADLDLIQSLAFSADGQTLAVGGYRAAKLWQRPRNVIVQSWENLGAGERPIVVTSNDGKWLAAGAVDGTVRVVELATGKAVRTWKAHTTAITAVRFSADGQSLFTAATDKTVLRWRLPDGVEVGRLSTPAAVGALALVEKQTLLATGEADGRVRIWALPAGAPPNDAKQAPAAPKPLRELTGHSKAVVVLETLPGNDAQLLSASEDGAILFWNASNGKLARKFVHGGGVLALAVRPDGQRFVSVGTDKVARLWNLADGKPLAEMRGDPRAQAAVVAREREVTAAKNDIAFAKGVLAEAEKNATSESEAVKKAGEAIAAAEKALAEKTTAAKKANDEKLAADKAVVEAAEAAKQAPLAKAAAEKALAEAVAAHKAAQARLKEAREAAKKDAQDKKLAEAQQAADKVAATAAAALKAAQDARSAAEKAIAATSAKAKQTADAIPARQKSLTDAEQARQQAEASKLAATKSLATAKVAAQKAADRVPAAKQLVAAAEARLKAAEADLAAAKLAATAAEAPLRAVAFSPDGQIVATAGDDKLVHTFSGETGAVLELHERHASTLRFLDDRRLFCLGEKGAAVWDVLPEWTFVRTLGASGSAALVDRVTALDFSPDGKLLATGGGSPSRSGELKLWNTADGTLARELADAHSDTVLGVKFSPDGKLLASCGADKFLKVFDVASGKFVRAFEGHTHHVLSAGWSSDGRSLASAGADSVVKIWDFASGDQRRTIQGFGKEVTSVAFIGDSGNVLAGSGDKTVRIVRAGDGGNVRTLTGAGDFVFAAAATFDGKIIVAGGQDSRLRVWNGENGQSLRVFDPPAVVEPAAGQAAKK